MATKACVRPAGIDGLTGVTAIDTRLAAVTVSVAVPVRPSTAAPMVVVPTAAEVARPCEPAALLIVAAGLDELQVTRVVRGCMVPSVYTPVAVNCWVVPSAMLGFAGVTLIETSDAPLTVNTVEPVAPFKAAVMVDVPPLTPVAKPTLPGALLMVATKRFDELQVTDVVMFCVELSV